MAFHSSMSLSERLDVHTAFEPNTGCWIWTGATTAFGYGSIRLKYGTSVHRVRYEQKFGKIPGKLCVLHKCDNPLCGNPDHMFLGTIQDNNLDRDRKGRTRKGKKTYLDDLQIAVIRSFPRGMPGMMAVAKYFKITYERLWSVRTTKYKHERTTR